MMKVKKFSGFAVAGFVLSLVGAGILGLIFSAIALHRIHKYSDEYRGEGLAIAGLVIGIIMSLFQFMFIIVIISGSSLF